MEESLSPPLTHLCKLLEGRNGVLKRLLVLTQGFRMGAEAELTPREALEELLNQRERLFEALGHFDNEIVASKRNLQAADLSPLERSRLHTLLEERSALTDSVIRADETLFTAVEGEKAALLHEILHSRKTSDTLRKFKSQAEPVARGEGLDRKA